MMIGDKFILNPVSTLKPVQTPVQAENGEAEDKRPGRFDELFSTIFTASNPGSKELSAASRESSAELVLGDLEDLPAHMVTGEKSSIAFELNLNIRNKMLDAYSEVLKTQI